MVTRRRLPKKPIWKRSVSELTRKQRHQQDKSLNLVKYMRKGLSPAQASALAGISVSMARKNTNAFVRKHRRWYVKKVDHVPRQMMIYENARKVFVEINDSRVATLIGKYHNYISQYLNTRDSKWLRKLLRKKTIRDSKGKRHRLETRLLIIIALEKMKPRREIFHIYIG